MSKVMRALIGLGILLVGWSSQAADGTKNFNLQGTNPGGKGGYTGTVEITKSGDTMAVRWLTGAKHEETLGFAIEGENTIGAGYGGEALYSIAVYELKGKTIHATWALTSKPGTVGKYDLKGSPAFQGKYTFANGTRGSMQMTPNGDGSYKMSWDLESGHFEGIGIKLGDSLVAVSGAPGAALGVAAYQQKGTGATGVWTAGGGVGQESWLTPGEDSAAPATASGDSGKDAKTIAFGGDNYLLKNSQSAPGKATSELREYLQAGEEWEGYRKMIGLREMSKDLKGDATTLARGTLAETKKNYPNSYEKELLMEPEHAVILFIILSGQDAEYNMFDYRRNAAGFVSAQFVLRNKAPYDTKAKFKAEQDAHFSQWTDELAALSSQAPQIIEATRGQTAEAAAPAAPATPPAKSDLSPELVEAIQADLQKCSVIAQKFLGFIKDGDVKSAVTLMGNQAFAKMTREEFTAGLTQSNKTFGALQDFVPDKAATDFGVVKGVMTFTLKGDAKYANSASKDTFRFIRERGEIELINYTRDPKP